MLSLVRHWARCYATPAAETSRRKRRSGGGGRRIRGGGGRGGRKEEQAPVSSPNISTPSSRNSSTSAASTYGRASYRVHPRCDSFRAPLLHCMTVGQEESASDQLTKPETSGHLFYTVWLLDRSQHQISWQSQRLVGTASTLYDCWTGVSTRSADKARD